MGGVLNWDSLSRAVTRGEAHSTRALYWRFPKRDWSFVEYTLDRIGAEGASSAMKGGRAELVRWVEPFLTELNHLARRFLCLHHVTSPIGLSEHKSIQPMAARQNGPSCDCLQRFISVGRWNNSSLTRTLLAETNRMVRGHGAMLVIDSLP